MPTHYALRPAALRRLLNVVLFFALAPGLLALPSDPDLYLDPTYGLFPRGDDHQYFPSPDDWRDVNIYQIFTDRFADGDTSNNTTGAMGINRSNWFESGKSFPQNRNYYHGGDWKGLKDNLDYLTGMGVNAVWISGVQMNDQGKDTRYTPYHMYHPTDFFNVDPVMGTFQDLKDLIDAAHARGVYVILDVVINHTADLNGLWGNNQQDDKGYFGGGNNSFGWWDNRRHAYPFDDLQWFHNNGTINNWDSYPEYIYGQFKGTDDLATEKDHVKYWITEAFKNLIDATDCDGFRVDAIKHVDEQWIKQWADDMRQHAASRGKNDFILFGEYFIYNNDVLARYCKDPGYSFNSALFFPMSQTIKNVFVDGQWTGQLTQALAAKNQYGEGANRLVTFIDNHDVNRIGLFISPQGDTGRINWVMKPALTFLYTATPVPCLFYGTEHAFNQGGHFNGSAATFDNPDDGDWQRENMSNRGFQPGPANGNKLLETSAPQYLHIKALNEARKNHPALRRGSFIERWQSGSAGGYAFSRVLQDQEALVAVNTSDGNQAINPQVGKPDGTEFVNVLDPAEKVTVSGGRIAFTLGGRDSKIFVAGQLERASEASTTYDATNFTVTYLPNDGPLKDATGPVRIGVSIDGGAETFHDMTQGQNGAWTYSAPYEGIASTLAVTFRDSSATPAVDTTGGAAWTFDATGFGQSLVQWVGNVVTYPSQGNITASNDLWVDVEAYPQGEAAGGKVVYTTDGGATWQEKALAVARVNGNNDLLNVNLGRFAPGTSLRFAVQVVDRFGLETWDNDGGADYTRTVQNGTLALDWLGKTYHWPLQGEIEDSSDFWVNIQTYPQGAAFSGEVGYSTDGGDTWQTRSLQSAGTIENDDLWNCNLGTFPAGTSITFYIKVVDTTGEEHYDNRGGANYLATVNGMLSSISSFSTPTAKGRSDATRPQVSVSFDQSGNLFMHPVGRSMVNTYKIWQSDDLSAWQVLRTVPAGDEQDVWDLLEAGDMANATRKFFRVEAIGGVTPNVVGGGDALVSIETYPPDGATAANVVFSTDGGLTWWPAGVAMNKSSSDTEGDTWTVKLPVQPSVGDQLRYAIELVDTQGNSTWVNNGGTDFLVAVRKPGQTDFTAPTASHSPSNTISANTSIQVTLTAVDDVDPAPVIHYTTNGSKPTTSSAVYSAPLTFTDTGADLDATLRYFAVDADGNRSATTSVEIRLGQTREFGPNKPYSTNPTLGAAGTKVIDGANNGEWTDDNLIAIGMANDDPRSLGSNWTMHEAPLNITHMWAAWDETHLYLAWQFVDVTDIVDPANAGGAGSGRIGSNDGILQWIALDTKPGQGATMDMWGKNFDKNDVPQPLWNGEEKPDFQVYLAGSLWQGYISRAVDNVFPVDDGGVNYFAIADAGVTAANGAIFAGSSLWGINDADDRKNNDAPNRNFASLGHDTSRDSFYEMKIPLAFLGLTRAQLESQGLGVMVGAGSNSTLDALPQDDGATLDSEGVEVWNSSLEWGDVDSITAPFARIGAW